MSEPVPSRTAWIAAALVLALAFAAFVLPPVAMGLEGTSEAYDEREYHRPTIDALAEQLPRPDLVNIETATSPGYHLVLAVLVRAGLDDARGLRAAASLFTLAMLLVAWGVAARRAGPWTALLLVAPLVASSYVIGAAAWLTTDNAALLFVLAAMAACLAPTGARAIAVAGLLAAAAVWTRQVHLWVAGLPILATLLALAGRPLAPLLGDQPTTFVPPWAGWTWPQRIAVGLAGLLPFVVVGALVALWGGLVPPSLSDYHDQGLRFTQPVLTLALIGGFGVCFAPILVAPGRWRAGLPIAIGVAAGLLALLVPTSYDQDAGRWGGAIWEAVRRLPAPADRSIVFPPLVALGGWLLAHAAGRLRSAGAGWDLVVLGCALAGWTAAHTFNAQTWQRYAEPILLIWLAWAAALVLRGAAGGRGDAPPRWWVAGPGLLLLVQLGLLSVTLWKPMVDAAGG